MQPISDPENIFELFGGIGNDGSIRSWATIPLTSPTPTFAHRLEKFTEIGFFFFGDRIGIPLCAMLGSMECKKPAVLAAAQVRATALTTVPAAGNPPLHPRRSTFVASQTHPPGE